MLKYFIERIFILVLCIGISACAPLSGRPIALADEAGTAIPTPTSSPIVTPTAAATAYPTLSTQEPYLMIQKSEQVIFEYDADGLGRKVIELPPDGHMPVFPRLDSIVSPNGEWLAFYTGNIGRGDALEDLPITLNLLNIRNGKVLKIADIAADGHIEKLELLAEDLKVLNPDKYKPMDNQDWVFGSVLSAFTWSIESASWSPDGHMLAFAAQIDGVSSDVYLYNMDTGSIVQLENTIQSVSNIQWSPDGKYVVFENSEPGNVYTGSSLYAVQPSGRVIDNPKKLYDGTWLHVGNWLSPNLILVADGTDTAGNFNLQTLDIRTGQLRPLWMDSISDYAIDPLNKIIAINAGEEAELENLGVYFITFSGQQTKVLEGLYWATLFFRGGKQNRFLIQGVSATGGESTLPISGDVVGLAADGKPTIISGPITYDKISISPDNSWLLMYDEKNLYLYDANDNLTQTYPINRIRNAIWRPDSQAIFFSDDSAIYFLPIPNGEPRLIDECEQFSCALGDIAWLP